LLDIDKIDDVNIDEIKKNPEGDRDCISSFSLKADGLRGK